MAKKLLRFGSMVQRKKVKNRLIINVIRLTRIAFLLSILGKLDENMISRFYLNEIYYIEIDYEGKLEQRITKKCKKALLNEKRGKVMFFLDEFEIDFNENKLTGTMNTGKRISEKLIKITDLEDTIEKPT